MYCMVEKSMVLHLLKCRLNNSALQQIMNLRIRATWWEHRDIYPGVEIGGKGGV